MLRVVTPGTDLAQMHGKPAECVWRHCQSRFPTHVFKRPNLLVVAAHEEDAAQAEIGIIGLSDLERCQMPCLPQKLHVGKDARV